MNKQYWLFPLIKSLITVAVIFINIEAHAVCNTNTGGATPQTQTISPGVIKVQRDVPVGTTIATFTTAQTDTALSCTGGTSGFYSEMVLFPIPSGTPHVYQTNVTGVGVMINSGSNYFEAPASFTSITGPIALNFVPRTITFVKTGGINSGTLNSGLLARIYGNGDNVTAVAFNITSTQIIQLSCSITTPILNFPIGDVLVSKFGTSVGTIPSGAENTQNLGLNCDAGANINVTLHGTQNPDVSTASVLALTGQGSADVASGVGVQLLYNSTPLELNNRIVLKQSASGQETFPLTARYYQTKTAVTPGKANTTATLDLTYQ